MNLVVAAVVGIGMGVMPPHLKGRFLPLLGWVVVAATIVWYLAVNGLGVEGLVFGVAAVAAAVAVSIVQYRSTPASAKKIEVGQDA